MRPVDGKTSQEKYMYFDCTYSAILRAGFKSAEEFNTYIINAEDEIPIGVEYRGHERLHWVYAGYFNRRDFPPKYRIKLRVDFSR